jgi:hypothetical protein
MSAYLVMCATNADDIVLQSFAGKEQAEEYAAMVTRFPATLDEIVRKELDKMRRDWSDPQCVYLACLGAEIDYDFRDEWQIN